MVPDSPIVHSFLPRSVDPPCLTFGERVTLTGEGLYRILLFVLRRRRRFPSRACGALSFSPSFSSSPPPLLEILLKVEWILNATSQ